MPFLTYAGAALAARRTPLRARVCLLAGLCLAAAACAGPDDDARPPGRGGTLIVAERSGPRTFNPVLATDAATKAILGHVFSDLIHINRRTLTTEPALADAWQVSDDGRTFRVHLRQGVAFSDGTPLTTEDVLFSFRVYLDPLVHAPQRDLLIVGGSPVAVARVDAETVAFTFAEPYAAAERLFDGLAILPRHRLAQAYDSGAFASAWGIDTAPGEIVGTGPFRLLSAAAGDRVVLERNPHYWKRSAGGDPLPYLDLLVVRILPNEDAEWLRFTADEIQVVNRLGADAYAALADRQTAQQQLADAGPSLEYNFLFFNLNDPPPDRPAPASRAWFTSEAFRHAVSAAIDREAIVRLVYRGRGEPLWGPVSSGNARWRNDAIPREPASLEEARRRLASAGFAWQHDGTLIDAAGTPVAFTLLVAASNQARVQMATLVQADLARLGMRVTVTPMEFRATVDRVLTSKTYDAALFGLVSGDADPNGDINVWLSTGATHLWRPSGAAPATAWEAEIDTLLRQQISERDPAARKRLYDRVQRLLAEHEPMIFLASPHVLAAAHADLEGFAPAALPPYTLWNADQLRWRPRGTAR